MFKNEFKINGKIPKDDSLLITVNNETKRLSALEAGVTFDLPENKSYEVNIEKTPDKNKIIFLNIVIFILTSVINSIGNILLMNTDSKWYKNISAYCFKAKTVFTLHPDNGVDVEFTANKADFKNQLYGYIKRFLSIAICALIMFVVLMYVALTSGIKAAIITVSVLIIALVLLTIGVIIAQCQKYKMYNLYP